MNTMPSIPQVTAALEAHYGPRTVGAKTFDEMRDAAMARRNAANRILTGCRRNSRPALAALHALSLETAHETMTREEQEDAAAETPMGTRAKLWHLNPACAECGETISAPHEGGRLFWFAPERLAHIRTPGTEGQSCFIAAMMRRRNPEHVRDVIPRVLPTVAERAD